MATKQLIPYDAGLRDDWVSPARVGTPMPVENAEIAALFNRYADLLEIEDANPFRVRAYRNAARTIAGYSRSMAQLVAEGRDLDELPGIGKDLAAKIETIVNTGRLPQLELIQKRTPRALSDLMQLPGLGPKRVKLLYRELHIRSAEDLLRAARSGELATLPGFGGKTIEKVVAGLGRAAQDGHRLKLAAAEQIAQPLVAYLRRIRGVKTVDVAGSFRRRRETVGDLDILVTCANGVPVMRRFAAYEDVAEVLSEGDTRSAVRLRSGVQVDLRVVPQESHGAALYYFTGSKEHNIAVRKLAVARKLKINEYGVYRGRRCIAGRTEEEVLRSVALPFIPPELRENRGEIEAARRHRLPNLVTREDIRGDLHCHTNASDGSASLKEMAQAAQALGYAYMAVTDHSKRLTVAHGLDRKRLLAQLETIDKLNAKLKGFRVLKSMEVDILEDGSLDMSDDALRQLDLVVASIHSKFDLPRKRQTERVIRAMDNPFLNIIGHPSGRLIGEREPMEIDIERLLHAAKQRGCFFEVNAQPDRLDLNDVHCKMAKDIGLKLAISSDAHSIDGLQGIRYGVDQARRGWLEPADVLNAMPLDRLLRTLKR
ncbi:MAG: DNA polymerase/3'-5' exonuclease PolX [Bacillota bacterium]